MELVKLELTPEECLLFRKFREHQDKFQTLIENGVFNVRNGTATLNFDGGGTLTQIEINVLMYKKGYPVVVHIV